MHIPDGYISPQTAGGLWALVVPAWYAAGYKVKRALSARQAPLIAIGAAFTFVIMMFNIPLPGGTSGHAVGGTLIAIVIGPWAAVIAISVALAIQALFFGDGGILALGANCFNIGFVLPVSGYFTYRLLSRGASSGSFRSKAAAGVGAWAGLNLAALLTAVEFGLQGEFYTAADGSALYSPYGLATAIPAMVIPHLAVVGVVEGVVTLLVLTFIRRTNPRLLENYQTAPSGVPGRIELKPLLIGLALLLVCTPLGLLATGTAWGEWGPTEVKERVGYVPEGMESDSGFWSGFLPDYAYPETEGPIHGGDTTPAGTASLDDARRGTPAYIVSGVIGLAIVSIVALFLTRLLTRGRQREKHG